MTDATTPTGPGADVHGYLLVHFRQEPGGEQIHFSLSEPGTALRWRPLGGGRPVLRSTVGTRGVRDPVLTRDDDGRFHVLATDLRIEDGGDGWDEWVRTGSRNLVLWDSDDLVHWEGPRLVEVAPPSAGMAWAPEVTVDPDTGDRIVFWSSRLYDQDGDPDHRAPSYSRTLFSRTRDFVAFSPAEVLVDEGVDVIDTAILHEGGRVHRIGKHEDRSEQSRKVHHQVGSSLFSDDYETLAVRIAADLYESVEAPILFRKPDGSGWYLFLDQYSQTPQGYFAMETDDLTSGRWTRVPAEQFELAPGTKHGGILALDRTEWERLAASA